MQMTPDQLLEEFRDTVLELHLTRRSLNKALHDNELLREELSRINGEAAQPVHHHGGDEHAHEHAA